MIIGQSPAADVKQMEFRIALLPYAEIKHFN